MLQKAGLVDVAWIFERLHSDALLAPLAHVAQDAAMWKTLGDFFVYNSREVQTQIQTDSISDVGVKWIALRMLQRGRYTRFVALKDGGHWDALRDSVRLWELPMWWSPPWNRPPNHPRSEQSRGRRPLLPKEWHRNQDRRRGHSSIARNQPPRPSDRSRSRERPLMKQSAVAATPEAPVPVAVGKNRRGRKRAKTTKADLKGGFAQSSTFRFAALNVTSLFSRIATVCALAFGLAFVSETSLTSIGQDILTRQLQQAGRCVIWGAPVEGKGVSSSKGVALIGGKGVRISSLSLPSELEGYWKDGRVVAGKLSQSQGHSDVTCVACYGHTHDTTAREDLLGKLVGWISTLSGNVVFAGDLNSALHDSCALHQLLRRGYSTANMEQEVTCCAHNSHAGSVIDHVLFSPSLAHKFVGSEILSEAPFPTHKPVCADFALSPVRDSWYTVSVPRELPVSNCLPTPEAEVVYGCQSSHINNLISQGQFVEAYTAWTQLAEKELACQCRRAGKAVGSFHFGRAEEPKLKLCQPSSRINGDLDFRRLERARSGLAELCSCWTNCVNQGHSEAIWANARRRISLVFPSHALPSEMPDRTEVAEHLGWLRREIEKRNAQKRRQGVQDWQTRLKHSQAERFRWAEAKYVRWQSIDNTAACFDKIEGMWKQILARRQHQNMEHASSTAVDDKRGELDAQKLRQLDLLAISGSDLMTAVRNISCKSSCGADGWRREELLALPQFMWDLLASVLHGMASSASWHPCLSTVTTTLIPKKASADFIHDPATLRPISVASIVYRAWAAVMAKRLHALLECSLPSCCHGFRAGESAQSAMANTYLRCQNASMSGTHIHLISYDMCKCFDSLPWRAVHDSLVACGVHPSAANALHSLWTNLRRIWKLQGRFHDASFLSKNGLFQGDPTAPACLAAFLCQPIRELGKLFPEVLVSVYADDVLISSNDPNQLLAAHEFFVRWLQEQNVELNTRKCTWASTCQRPVIPAFHINGVELKRTEVLETLGGHLDLADLCVGSLEQWSEKLEQFFTLVKRLRSLPIGYDLRSRDLGSLMAMLTYSAIAWDPNNAVDQRMQRTLVNMLAGETTNTRRCLEVCLGLLSPIHRSSIPEALLHEQVSLLFRLVNTNREFQNTVKDHFDLCSGLPAPPEESFFARFQKALHVVGWKWISWHELQSRDGTVFSLLHMTIEARRAQLRPALVHAQDVVDMMQNFHNMIMNHKRELREHTLSCLHTLREDMRQVSFLKAGQRRRDMRDLATVDRNALRHVLEHTAVDRRPVLRCIMQGAILTADRMHRSSKGAVSSLCPFCHSSVETEIHRWWSCQHWNGLRALHLGRNAEIICEQLSSVSNVASICGIPTHGLSPLVRSQWINVCACMIDIQAAANNHER